MSRPLKVLDLFCGAAGGWSLGLHWAGAFETIAACEVDDWRRAEFARKFPQARMYADVRQLTGAVLRADGLVPDIIVGSPPCQDASTANAKGKGVDGERTGLFFDAVRLVREVRPRWVCFENVPGLRTRGYDRIHDALETAGYAVRPFVVGAWHAGANHRRNRVWIVANSALVQRPTITRNQPNRACQMVASHALADAASEQVGAAGQSWESPFWRNWNDGAPDLGGVDDGLPKGMARRMLSAYGDAVIPQIPELIGRAILHAEGLA